MASSHKDEARPAWAITPGPETSSWDSGADESHEMATSALLIKCTQEKMRLQAFPLSKMISRNT
jgi:hypothetical protein